MRRAKPHHRLLLGASVALGLAVPSADALAALAVPGAPGLQAADGGAAGQEGFSDRVSGALRPEPGGLTADQVARAAVENSPSVEQLRAELQSTAASVDDTLSRFVPNVKGSATYSRLSPADIDFGGGGASVGATAEGPLTVDPVTGLVVGADGQPVGAVSFGPLAVPLDNFSLQASVTVPILDYIRGCCRPGGRGGKDPQRRAPARRREAAGGARGARGLLRLGASARADRRDTADPGVP